MRTKAQLKKFLNDTKAGPEYPYCGCTWNEGAGGGGEWPCSFHRRRQEAKAELWQIEQQEFRAKNPHCVVIVRQEAAAMKRIARRWQGADCSQIKIHVENYPLVIRFASKQMAAGFMRSIPLGFFTPEYVRSTEKVEGE